METLGPILQILSALFVVLWTARLAYRKGRNPLLWAGMAVLPIAGFYAFSLPEPITILCMGPMVALVFVRSRARVPAEGETDPMVACPRCQHSHEPGPSFCTNCGWELSRPYATADATPEPASTPTETPEPVIAASTAEAAESASHSITEAPTAATAPEPVLASGQVAEPPASSATGTTPVDAEPAPAFSAAPMKITRPLTASGMTEAGLTLFNQGRIREAVDQFTKAIALDPRYRDAWANRAKAYSELGLSDKAAADQRQLEAI